MVHEDDRTNATRAGVSIDDPEAGHIGRGLGRCRRGMGEGGRRTLLRRSGDDTHGPLVNYGTQVNVAPKD